jgi:16S rRNA (cytosine1402-N4)-methyltransferase
MTTKHIPVLAQEVLEWLEAKRGGVFLDGTFGGGGHSKMLLEANSNNLVVACDRDPKAQVKIDSERLSLFNSNYSEVFSLVPNIKFNGVLLDLGLSTDQLYSGRGFSFHDKDSLDMRMDGDGNSITAQEIVNSYGPKELRAILKRGGVGKELGGVMDAILKDRPFNSAAQLAESIKKRFPKPTKTHPATVVFQALRIAVNDEFTHLNRFLDQIPGYVLPKARLAIISFHSLEDEVVTKRFRSWEGEKPPANYRGREAKPGIGKLLTKKAVTPKEDETERNPASRSARMRVFEFYES